jgi:hypothetical protein
MKRNLYPRYRLTPTTSASNHHYEEESCKVVKLVVEWPSLM